jgi:hypothetical protein
MCMSARARSCTGRMPFGSRRILDCFVFVSLTFAELCFKVIALQEVAPGMCLVRRLLRTFWGQLLL